jgi:fido (protein-threonine AMPylation protein)
MVSDPNVMRETPESGAIFLEILQERHRHLMSARPENLPGEFKPKPNRAGDSHFVEPALVKGTLLEGYNRYRDLPLGLPRAIFVMFLVAEVHPFVDGNGRIARILMNAELVSQNLSSIIIPNVYRDSYLVALRALTRRSRPDPLVKMLSKAQGFSNFHFGNYRAALQYMQEHNWFREPDDATIIL